MAGEVRFFLELFQIILVGPAQRFPVEVAEVVARGIFAVLGELDGNAARPAAVYARYVPLHRQPCPQRQSRQPGQHLRVN